MKEVAGEKTMASKRGTNNELKEKKHEIERHIKKRERVNTWSSLSKAKFCQNYQVLVLFGFILLLRLLR